MSANYLLPCRCGQRLVVEPRRAGETIICSCGASLQIPTMLEMARLEPAPVESVASPADSGWSWRQRMLLVGIVLVSVAIFAGFLVFISQPIPPINQIDPEQIQENAKRLSPVRTWEIWQAMKQGPGRIDQRYAAALVRFHAWAGITAVVAAIGGAFLIMGWMPAPDSTRKGDAVPTSPSDSH